MRATVATEAFFLPRTVGQRFCLYHPPADAARPPLATLVHVHAFAEEMNKSRRMVALQCRRLAQSQFAVLQIDLAGCGDSSGEFEDARWDDWVADVVAAQAWIAARHAGAPNWLWGLRLGALIAGQAAQQLGDNTGLLLWQPALAGKTLLQQFLRLKAAAAMAEGAAAKSAMHGLRAAMAAGHTVEVGGYALSAALAQAMEAAELHAPAAGARVRWLELSTRLDAQPSPLAQQQATAWQAAGVDVRCQVVAGPAFWQTAEIEEAPLLLDATVAALLA